ncbi:MAG: (d)CMP kinase [Thermoanaerobaculia bacterium]
MADGPRIIAIDGPSGAGKSTLARMLAQRLRLPYLDTGAMYRAVGLLARRNGIRLPIEDPDAVASLARRSRIDLATSPSGTSVWLDGTDVSLEIREPEISLYASAVSAIPGVRRLLVARQREIGREKGGVVEGRDIGSKVFPDTPYKFFLTATEEERARRRHAELEARGLSEPYEKVLAEMRLRDRDDSARADSPLRLTEGHIRLESDGRTPEEIALQVLRVVGP